MWFVIRTSPYGCEGQKKFDSKEAAEQWLKTDSVMQDRADGFSFRIEQK